jgi:four helix bundle protein
VAQHYHDLLVWQKAIELVTDIYRLTGEFPKDELYGLTSQIRRAAVSIPSNIAEGQGRLSRGEFRQFLGQARGSYAELETQLIIARNLGYLPAQMNVFDRLFEVGRLLNGLLSSLSDRNEKPPTAR